MKLSASLALAAAESCTWPTDTLLQRPVVLKILRAGLLSAQQMRSTVLREARLASAIEHPNVCAIYEVGEAGDEGYIVMQFVPGQSIDQLIARGPATPQLAALGRHPDRRWSAGCACAGYLSSRPEAAECDADRRRARQDSRFWPCAPPAAGRSGFRPEQACAGERRVACRNVHCARRDDPLHGAGAVCYGPIERAIRCLGAGRDSV